MVSRNFSRLEMVPPPSVNGGRGAFPTPFVRCTSIGKDQRRTRRRRATSAKDVLLRVASSLAESPSWLRAGQHAVVLRIEAEVFPEVERQTGEAVDEVLG